MRECYSCRENDRSWSLSLTYRCIKKWCENYLDLEPITKEDDNEYNECFMKYF